MRPARRLLSVTVLSCAVLLAQAGSAAAAVEAGRDSHAQDMPNGVRFVVGKDQWQPGRHYKSSADWLALNCTPSACSLEPARLTVKAESWQGHYDDKPTRGQRLNFRKLRPGPGGVIAWFQLDAKHPWLRPGAVTTYASKTGRTQPPASEGTPDVATDLAVAALYRQTMGILEPTDAQIQRMLDRAAAWDHAVADQERLTHINAMAMHFYEARVDTGWAGAYLDDRLPGWRAHRHVKAGYAPASWTALIDHLGGRGVTDSELLETCLLYTSPSPRDRTRSRMPSSA